MITIVNVPTTLAPEDVTLVGAAINAVWRKVAPEEEEAVDAAFLDLMCTFGRMLPEGWPRHRFNRICTVGVEP
jgi:hypothetical protein